MVFTQIRQNNGGVLGGVEIGGKARRVIRGDFHSILGINTGRTTVPQYFQCGGGIGGASMVELGMCEAICRVLFGCIYFLYGCNLLWILYMVVNKVWVVVLGTI